MKKFEFEFDLRLCQEVTPPDGGGGTGGSGNGNDQGTEGPKEDDKKPIEGNDDDIIEPDPLIPPIGI